MKRVLFTALVSCLSVGQALCLNLQQAKEFGTGACISLVPPVCASVAGALIGPKTAAVSSMAASTLTAVVGCSAFVNDALGQRAWVRNLSHERAYGFLAGSATAFSLGAAYLILANL